ncbi:MAG: hypothetical protein CME59_07990 [Halioglobus sp.]|nr:hypothetical protein [Halioglobus sp.]|tara:strand:- start:1418 stop:1804 length:387 start_codon:yes stop_codon:yes gene_type:complete
MKRKAGARRAIAAMLIACMMLPQALWAQDAIDDSPNEFAMVGDLLVARPLGLVMVAGGTAVWLVSLPFTLLSGHAGEAAGTLIGGPVETTFMRCLGCRNPGYTGKDIERARENKEREEAEAEAMAAAE